MGESSSAYTKIKDLEDELKKTKYNKKTQYHIGLIKAKIAVLREKARTAGKKGAPPTVKKSGDATVILVGFPSVGKSTLLNALTNATSKVAAYAFTTLECIPGLMEYKHAKIQILDVPGIVAGAAIGTGRGKESLSYAMASDLVLIIVDVFFPEHLDVIKNELLTYNIRINQRKPYVKIERKSSGGVDVGATVKLTKIDTQTIKDILKEFRIMNANVVLREDIDADQFIDVIEGNKKYIPSVIALNKIDLVDKKELARVENILKPDIMISAEMRINLPELKEMIFQRLGLIRVFCKEIGKKADLDVPLIMLDGSTLAEVCSKLHRDFVAKFRYARIWGKGVKFEGMPIRKLSHRLLDGDIVELHIG